MMTTKKTSFIAFILVLALAFPSVVVQAASTKLNMSECTLAVGQKQQLTLRNATGKVTWSTSAKKVATVSKKGVVTAKKAGSAVIIAKYKGKNYACVITVVKKVSLNKTKVSLNVGDTYKLKLKNGTASVFVSEDDSIATVSSKGVVKGKAKGKTTITVLDSANNVYTCKVTISSSGTSAGKNANIPSDAKSYKNHYYKIYTQSGINWEDAKKKCVELGGHLVTITSKGEQDFIEKINSSNERLWIGGYCDSNYKWYWVTGEKWSYTNWGAGEPSGGHENSAAVWPKYWNDMSSDNLWEQNGYICEWDEGDLVSNDNPKPTATPIPTSKPNNTNSAIDLGGINIIVRDYWSPSLTSKYPGKPHSDYEETKFAYQDDIMEKYNFTIREAGMSDRGSINDDFVNYVKSGGDNNYYIFALKSDEVLEIMKSGYMYDLSTLDCLDFSNEKFQRNKIHEKFSIGNSIYAMKAGYSEPGVGVYFNKNVLKDAGIDPDDIYDAQKDGTWIWPMFEEIMAKCQRDINSDGIVDIYGLTCNENVMTRAAVLSNGGSFVEKTSNKKEPYVYNLESAKTTEALWWCTDMYTKYNDHDPIGASWDYYQDEWKSGKVAFCVDGEYLATSGNMFQSTTFDMGFVMFPKGPKQDDYVNEASDILYVIPSCYDADKAWKIAFAWNEWTNSVPGYEGYNEYYITALSGNFDQRALDETIPMMSEPSRKIPTYDTLIEGLFVDGLYQKVKPLADISEICEKLRDEWKYFISKANK